MDFIAAALGWLVAALICVVAFGPYWTILGFVVGLAAYLVAARLIYAARWGRCTPTARRVGLQALGIAMVCGCTSALAVRLWLFGGAPQPQTSYSCHMADAVGQIAKSVLPPVLGLVVGVSAGLTYYLAMRRWLAKRG